MNHCQILIIGAGGLGCDLIKCLALSGFRKIHLIDLDTIDLSNLNRQFLFRKCDVGEYKSTVAAHFVMKRVPGCNITAHTVPIQDKEDEFYEQFHIVISGLDSIKARRWMNFELCELIELDEDGHPDITTSKIFIDGGTEGFRGQAHLMQPMVTSCFECRMNLFPQRATFPQCTIVHNPRSSEHCIQFVLEVLWSWSQREPSQDDIKTLKLPQPMPPPPPGFEAGGDPIRFDGDNPDHVTWVYELALTRAKEHNIRGVTWRHTQGVAKNIIPAIASTNAIIAAACANEALKAATLMAPNIEHWMMYAGNEGINTFTYSPARNVECLACGTPPVKVVHVNPATTKLEDILKIAAEDAEMSLPNPSIVWNDTMLYDMGLKQMQEISLENAAKTLSELEVEDNAEFVLLDSHVSRNVFKMIIRFAE